MCVLLSYWNSLRSRQQHANIPLAFLEPRNERKTPEKIFLASPFICFCFSLLWTCDAKGFSQLFLFYHFFPARTRMQTALFRKWNKLKLSWRMRKRHFMKANNLEENSSARNFFASLSLTTWRKMGDFLHTHLLRNSVRMIEHWKKGHIMYSPTAPPLEVDVGSR
jgi:hypothetical protein